jgi:hypothetical protein
LLAKLKYSNLIVFGLIGYKIQVIQVKMAINSKLLVGLCIAACVISSVHAGGNRGRGRDRDEDKEGKKGVDPTTTPTPSVPGDCYLTRVVDFNTDVDGDPISAGTYISNQYASWGVVFDAFRRERDGSFTNLDGLMIFDSSNPTGGDPDLGTPNSAFGGPGTGKGGETTNKDALGNVGIITEDGDVSDPDDNRLGGRVVLDFAYNVDLVSMYFVDNDASEASYARCYTDVNPSDLDAYFAQVTIGNFGDNNVQVLDLSECEGVRKLVLFLGGSGGISHVLYKVPEPCEECGECDGKVTSLTLKYLDADAADVVVVDRNNVELFRGRLQSQQEFTFEGKDSRGTMGTEIKVMVNGVLHVKIHTSCSQPIGPGSVYGDFLVVSGRSRNGGLLCPVETVSECGCEGKVTRLRLQSAVSGHIKVVQKFFRNYWVSVFEGQVSSGGQFEFSGVDRKGTLGVEIKIYVDGVLRQSIHTSCSEPIGVGSVFGSFTVVSGASRTGGVLCPAEGPQDPSESNCGCEGKVTRLTLRNEGKSGYVKVYQSRGTIVAFQGFVASGSQFTVHGGDCRGTLGTEIKIFVDRCFAQSIHTSCSTPIGVGSRFGDFVVLEGASRTGGELCLIGN